MSENEESTRLAYSVKRFANEADISVRQLYSLWQRGEGPPITTIGGRKLITAENGKRWLRERTAA